EPIKALRVPARKQVNHGSNHIERQVVVTHHLKAQTVDVEIDPNEHAAQSVGDVVEDVEQQNHARVDREAFGRGQAGGLREKAGTAELQCRTRSRLTL